MTDDEIVEAVERLGRVTVRWSAPPGCRVGIRARSAVLARLWREGRLDRETYRVAPGIPYAGELETAYFSVKAATAPLPAYAGARAAYPGRAP